eukprot:TRINITY_DN2669_c0_g1_i2.p1 TRINITY_DN2669_c0_g1~~TRINITY_DN2669_c0_g1_i2.p1  ORF type:complete len:442 (+),score=88.08 TRINITY_DN2669_c0_g1_i2:77-1402(+)
MSYHVDDDDHSKQNPPFIPREDPLLKMFHHNPPMYPHMPPPMHGREGRLPNLVLDDDPSRHLFDDLLNYPLQHTHQFPSDASHFVLPPRHHPVEHQHKSNWRIVSSVNLFKLAQENPQVDLYHGLSKPSFCPTNNSYFVCGTEEQDSYRKNLNILIFGHVDDHNNITSRFTYRLGDYVRDIQWIDTTHIVFAINQKLGLVRLNAADLTINDVVMFPEFHKDAIREICVSEGNTDLVISGGFDGNVFVTDISRLINDIQRNEKKSENSLYPCREVVGSVQWHPNEPCLASCTTDTGTLHIFDIRTDKKRAAIVQDTQRRELFTHCYRDDTTMLLGYGDASIQPYDIRTRKMMPMFSDVNQKQIGEIRFNYSERVFATFGSPQMSLWNYGNEYSPAGNCLFVPENSELFLSGRYKTSGDFRRGTKTVLVTDSMGMAYVYDFGH